MNINRWIILTVIVCFSLVSTAAEKAYQDDPTYLALRDSVFRSFNEADSARFFSAVKNLEDYLLKQDDLHAYYTQRCNEIVFMMNTEQIFEAYKAAQQLSKELRERQLDSEMYMAVNMMGHIQRYCGNYEIAKKSFRETIALMEKEGYYESLPPIYMNIVNVEMEENPEEALTLLEKAAEIARQYSPDRVFDIESRRALFYYSMGDMDKFVEAYNAYRKGVAEGLSSVHGRTIEIYHHAYEGNVDEAVEMTRETMGDDGADIIVNLYKNAGRWEDAYEAQRKLMLRKDSINSVILGNSMMGIKNELTLYEMEHETAKNRMVTMAIIIILLVLLILALVYISFSHRRHMRQLNKAYQHALQSDKMKTVFIQNMSHEVRTPLNIIMGFAQVLADPDLTPEKEERAAISKLVLKNTHTITNQIDEMIELSINETAGDVENEPDVDITNLLSEIIEENEDFVKDGVTMCFDNLLPDGFTMSTNKHMLRRMVNSLLDNACKYTNEGSITLRARTDQKNLIITVEDTGSGIDQEQAHRIFDRFVKLDNFKEGLGLGLSLCRLIATRMKGSVTLDDSYEGPGARFVISIPVI